VKQSTSVKKSTSVKQSTSKDLTDATGQRVVLDDRSSFIVDRNEDDDAMEVDEQEEIVVEKLENEPADLNKVASNLTNSFIAAGRALSQESLVDAVTHVSEDEDEDEDPTNHEASFDELDKRRASLIDISSQVLLAESKSDEGNKAFLEEQPNFLPENDREIVQNIIEQSNTDQVESNAAADIEPFGTEKADEAETTAADLYGQENGQEVILEDGSKFVVDNDEDEVMELEAAESETESQTAEPESTNEHDVPDAGKEVEEVASELAADKSESGESSNSESDNDSASADTSDASGNVETVDDINITDGDAEAITPGQSARTESMGVPPSAAAPMSDTTSDTSSSESLDDAVAHMSEDEEHKSEATSETIITENTKPVPDLVASFESKVIVEPTESEEALVAPNVAARAIPPVADAVDLEEVMPSIEQKSNKTEPTEEKARKSFGERIKSLVRCCQQK